MFSNLRGWEWLLIVALVLLLFGAKRLPDAARGLGRSLRIFKAETRGLVDAPEGTAEPAGPAVEAGAPATPPAVTAPATVAPPAATAPPAVPSPAATPPAAPQDRAEG